MEKFIEKINCLKFNGCRFIVGDLVTVSYLNDKGITSAVTGRIHAISDDDIIIDHSVTYMSRSTLLGLSDILDITKQVNNILNKRSIKEEIK